ncbi:OPA3 family protein Ecym_3047 [Eremothecium cymbalariae DBVPG|uniref:OPA3-like protein n=1 Tax=Eremothecium cymbalariae (strain CBS 270.75 / DBVPG 7215 / KCTC 17166 / NRRL Y-17582) TaxID=931890 RepID=G8JQZ1_ERECY|nr:Hypothetical protein Ecym_3047 [Eremothecium cymbalariae DBVPG\
MSGIAIKLGTLLIRQVTRPVANVLRLQAKQHAAFKNLCIKLAQKMHRMDVALRNRLTYNNSSKKIRPLNDERAVENGATLISELFVFGVTGSVVAWETLRQRNKELSRREQVEQDIEVLQSEIEELRKLLGGENKNVEVPGKQLVGKTAS